MNAALPTDAVTPLLNPSPPAESESQVTAIFSAIQEHIGFIPDGLRLYGISPPLLETFAGNVSYFQTGTSLSPVLTTMIRYLVSAQSGCSFCIDLNEGFLDQMQVNLDQARSAREDPEFAPVTEQEKPLLRLALKAVQDPHAVDSSDVEAARQLGWTDREVFDAVVQAANTLAFNHVLGSFNVKHQGAFA